MRRWLIGISEVPSLCVCDAAQVSYPMFNTGFDYFYTGDLDVNILCQALARVLTELPLLGGRLKGCLYVRTGTW